MYGLSIKKRNNLSSGKSTLCLAPSFHVGLSKSVLSSGQREECTGGSCQSEQIGQGCRPFSLQAVHLRALKLSVKQLRKTDILLPWHIGHGTKANPPQAWHVCGCCTRCEETTGMHGHDVLGEWSLMCRSWIKYLNCWHMLWELMEPSML